MLRGMRSLLSSPQSPLLLHPWDRYFSVVALACFCGHHRVTVVGHLKPCQRPMATPWAS